MTEIAKEQGLRIEVRDTCRFRLPEPVEFDGRPAFIRALFLIDQDRADHAILVQDDHSGQLRFGSRWPIDPFLQGLAVVAVAGVRAQFAWELGAGAYVRRFGDQACRYACSVLMP